MAVWLYGLGKHNSAVFMYISQSEQGIRQDIYSQEDTDNLRPALDISQIGYKTYSAFLGNEKKLYDIIVLLRQLLVGL